MSGESPLALAVSDAPQLDCVVIRTTDELPRIHWVELDAGDSRRARVRAAAADAWRDSRCTSGSSPESSRDRRIPHCT